MSIPLGKLVNVNPLTPEFLDNRDAEVSFLPLAAVWPYGRANVSGRAIAAKVAGGYTQFRNGDVLVPKITPTFEAARAIVADLETPLGAGTTELHVLRALPGVDARFIAYVTRSLPFLQEGATTLQGVGNLRRVPSDWLTKFPVLVADLEEQQAIADYLDRETQRIDELIAEQRGLIETLQERRRSVMTRLVTRGLDSDADLAESESKWLDLVPSSWKLTRFRFVANIDGVMVDPTRGDMPNEVLIAPNHVESGTGCLLAIETAGSQGADSNKYQVREGQIIYSKIRPTLNKAVIAPRDCLCSADMYPISFDSDQVASRYAALRS